MATTMTDTTTPIRERADVVKALTEWTAKATAVEPVLARAAWIDATLGDGRTPREGPSPSADDVDLATEERPMIAAKLAAARRAARAAEAAYRTIIDTTTAAVLAERTKTREPLKRAVNDAADALVDAIGQLEEFDSETARLSGGRRPECPFPQFLPSTPVVENLVDFRRRTFGQE